MNLEGSSVAFEVLGLVVISSQKDVFIETLVRFRAVAEIVGAQPELEEALVIGR